MQHNYLPFRDTGYFSSLVCDYLDEKETLRPFVNRFSNFENFKAQIDEKRASKLMSPDHRKALVSALKSQYKNLETNKITLQNINDLVSDNTFTITTGHQLNLFTGPLYFLYKIISAINLSKALKQTYPEYNFVPLYWMATEDHDFEEINYFNFKGKKIQWNSEAHGAVGDMSTQGLEKVFQLFSQHLGASKNASVLKGLFKKAYLGHANLADATRYLANELFKEYGLVILDAQDKTLKKQFTPFMKEELLCQNSCQAVSSTNNELNKGYHIQVNPRDINLFYLNKNIRARIVFDNQKYQVINTNITFTKAAILKELEEHPERFSPNVIMRPLYQEVILPNLCYIGGGGELAYWFQLKKLFNQVKLPFPILELRHSVLIQSERQSKKLQKWDVSTKDLFLKTQVLLDEKVKERSRFTIDFSTQKTHLKEQFASLYQIASETDKSFFGAVKAQETKQIKGLEKLEKRLLKAEKRNNANQLQRLLEIKNQLFPNDGLQEREVNFSELYLEYGEHLIPSLITVLNPLERRFLVLTL